MDEKTINLDNGLELVAQGKFKEAFTYEREILASFCKEGRARIFIRKIKELTKNAK